jgi:hypothetical protein
MRPRSVGDYALLGLIMVAVIVYAAKSFRKEANDVNPHDPSVGRIDAFRLQPGEVGVVLRVQHKRQPASSVRVWLERSEEDDDEGTRFRTGHTDAEGLVRVPMRKFGTASTQLFARDSVGRLGGAHLHAQQLLSAQDIELLEVTSRAGRLLSITGEPIAGAAIEARSFMVREPSTDGEAPYIKVPAPVQADYAVKTNADGCFQLPGVPVGYTCEVAFRAPGHGEGTNWLPADAPGEFRLAPSGSVAVTVSGDGKAADVRKARCQLAPTGLLEGAAGRLAVNGQRNVVHDGSDSFLIANVVPGKYLVQLDSSPRQRAMAETSVEVNVVSGMTALVIVPLKEAGRVKMRAVDGRTGHGIAGVRFSLNAVGYCWRLATGSDGWLQAYVPPAAPLSVVMHSCPASYALPRTPFAAPGGSKPVTVAAGETTTLPDTKLFTMGSISGVVMAEEKPVAGALVEVRWDMRQNRSAVAVKTNQAGRFEVANAPPNEPALIRVRAGNMVNPTVTFTAEDLALPVSIPLATEHAFRVRGQLTDAGGAPLGRAKIVIGGSAERPVVKGSQAPVSNPSYFLPMEIEAVFTDADGRFESSALWPGCTYTLNISAAGVVPRELSGIHGKPGQAHEVPSLVLRGLSATVAGVVQGADGQPLAGATVMNSGDATRRLMATTDTSGAFTLAGLYEGPVVLVAHKPGYRWGYAVHQPGATAPRIILPSLTDPPVPIAPIANEQRLAETKLIRRLKDLEEKQHAVKPGRADPDAASPKHQVEEARKNLDAYVARYAKSPGAGYTLTQLATSLAKEDQAQALRVLKEAAALAKRTDLDTPNISFLPGSEISNLRRCQELTRVAQVAGDLGLRDAAVGWLDEAESGVAKLPSKYRQRVVGMLAVAWVTLDSARTEKLLAGLEGDTDFAVRGIIQRLLRTDPEKTLPWFERLKLPQEPSVEATRAQVAIGLAERDFARARRLAESITAHEHQARAYLGLAGAARKSDVQVAHNLIERAAAALAAEGMQNERQTENRVGVAIELLWRAKEVGYPDLASLVVVALTCRPPLHVNNQLDRTWRWQRVLLAAGVASIDPATGRALLRREGETTLAEDEQFSYVWLAALALADPAAALEQLDSVRQPNPEVVLAVVKRRSAVMAKLSQGDWLANIEADDGQEP